MEIGQVVYSTAGRDSGNYFAIVELVDNDFVRIADGNVHYLKNAKLKRVKHLRANGDTLEKVAEKLKTGMQVFDAELYNALRLYNDKVEQTK